MKGIHDHPKTHSGHVANNHSDCLQCWAARQAAYRGRK